MSSTRKNTLLPDKEDGRITLIQTEPAFGINQTREPALLRDLTRSISARDGRGVVSVGLRRVLVASFGGALGGAQDAVEGHGYLTPARECRGRALRERPGGVAHGQFFTTSLTWSRALRIPLYLCEADKEWFQRAGDIRDSDKVVWWEGEKELGPGVRVIQCGG